MESNVLLKSLSAEEIKEGYVLSEDVRPEMGLYKSKVLSEEDIFKIRGLNIPDKIGVFILNSKEVNVPYEPANKHFDNHIQQKKHDLTAWLSEAGDKVITDEFYSQKLSHLIEVKKEEIRGFDYNTRLEIKKNEQLEKYKNSLKNSVGTEKTSAVKAIETCAKSLTDLESLQNIQTIATKNLVGKLDIYASQCKRFIDKVIEEKVVYAPYIENIVLDVVQDVGFGLSNALIGSLSRTLRQEDFFISHSLQVFLISLVIAIELSNLVNEKSKASPEGDVRALFSLEKKFFTFEDLINLGSAAILHDLGFQKNIPNLTFDYQLNMREQSLLDSHPSEGFHMLRQMNIDFEVQRAVYQHNERMDGSGGPNGILPRLFSKYTPILMFAEYFIEMTTQNPFMQQHDLPRHVIVDVLKNKKDQFDTDVVYAFIRAASLYPIGSWVELLNGEIGMVIGAHPYLYEKPIVRIFNTQAGGKSPGCFDRNLSQEDIQIHKPVSLELARKLLFTHQESIWANVS